MYPPAILSRAVFSFSGILTALLLVLCSHLYAQAPVNGLLAYWPMNGNYTDAGPSGINGTNMGSAATQNNLGVNGQAMAFSNPNSDFRNVLQYAYHPSNTNLNFSLSSEFTYDMMVYMSAPFIHAGGIYDNGVNTNGACVWFWNNPGYLQVNFNFGNASVGSTNGAVQYNTWHHITAIKTGNTLYLYIDGVLNNSGPSGTSAPVYSGRPGIFGSQFFTPWSPPYYNGHNGRLDEFRIYNRALTVAEIGQLQCLHVPGAAPAISPSADTSVCAGQSVTLSSSLTNGNQWYRNGDPLAGANGQVYQAVSAGSYYVVNTQVGCAGAPSDTVQVAILPGVALGADTTVFLDCPGQFTNLNLLYTHPGIIQFQWNTVNPASAPAGSYQLVALNAAGCSDTAVALVKLDIAEWTGAVSSNWHEPANWNTNRVPDAKTHVLISGTPANSCSIGAANGQAASIRLRNNNSVQINPDRKLEITGNCTVLP